MLDLSEIHMVEAVSLKGSINSAAVELNISQPTLTKRIARLEKRLNTVLFHRSSGGVVATGAASYLIAASKELSVEMKKIERQLELMSALEVGELRLGVGPIIEQIYLPLALARFVEKCPRINVSVQTDKAPRLLELLRNGELDVIVGPFDAGDKLDDLHVVQIAREPTIFVGRVNHPLAKLETPVKQKDLQGFPLASPSMPPSITRQRPMLASKQSQQRIECDNYSTLKQLVQTFDYICGGPRVIFQEDLDAGRFAEISTEEKIIWTAFCLVRHEAIHTPIVRLMVEIFEGMRK